MAYSSTAALATRQQPPSVMPSATPARFLPPSISWHGYRHCAGVGCCPAMRRWRGKPFGSPGDARSGAPTKSTEGGNGHPRATGAQPGAGFGEGIAVSETSASSTITSAAKKRPKARGAAGQKATALKACYELLGSYHYSQQRVELPEDLIAAATAADIEAAHAGILKHLRDHDPITARGEWSTMLRSDATRYDGASPGSN